MDAISYFLPEGYIELSGCASSHSCCSQSAKLCACYFFTTRPFVEEDELWDLCCFSRPGLARNQDNLSRFSFGTTLRRLEGFEGY